MEYVESFFNKLGLFLEAHERISLVLLVAGMLLAGWIETI